MTVKEMIEKLGSLNPDLEVDTEGCDCIEDAGAPVEQYGRVIITRKEGSFLASRAVLN